MMNVDELRGYELAHDVRREMEREAARARAGAHALAMVGVTFTAVDAFLVGTEVARWPIRGEVRLLEALHEPWMGRPSDVLAAWCEAVLLDRRARP